MIDNIFWIEKCGLMIYRFDPELNGSEPDSIVHETGGVEWDLVVGVAVDCLGENLVAEGAS